MKILSVLFFCFVLSLLGPIDSKTSSRDNWSDKLEETAFFLLTANCFLFYSVLETQLNGNNP